jgi:asparagine synthetase B (glutamine-hydrolysing)
MTVQYGLAFTESLPTEDDQWVFTLSLKEADRVLPCGVRWAERGSLRGFFHGMLFEREALADSSAHHEPNLSDADLVLRTYEREGEAALSKLRGSFVVVIIDRARGKAIVSRDPLGSHPLFYAETNSSVLFAAKPQPLLEHPGISRTFNRAALADHLCHRWPDPHETFFTAIRRLPPSWRAVISGGRLRLERYWDPMPEDQPARWLTPEETERFDEVFDRAIDRCIHSGHTGVFLSGGLDSISVAAVAADRTRQAGQSPPLALSLGFPDPACDERVRQAAIARDLGLRQYLVGFDEAVGSRPLFEQWRALNQHLAAPILNIWQPAYLELARRARLDGVQTIMTGHGGDEWLTVSPFLAADLMHRGAFVELMQLFATFWRSYKLRPHELVRNTFWSYGLRPLVGLMLHRIMPEAHKRGRPGRMMAGDPIWVAPDREIRLEQRRRVENNMPLSDPPQGFYLREVRTSIDHTLTSWDLEEQHELSKQVGVRFVHPFWDPDVVELLYRTPPRLLNGGGRSKGLVRRRLARRFPNLELDRQRKVAATSFFKSLLFREGPALADLAGDFPALSSLGVVDGRALRDVVHEELKQPGPRLQQIWLPLNLEMWLRSRIGHGHG